MFDDLRSTMNEDDDDLTLFDDDEDEWETTAAVEQEEQEKLFLGMTAVERMFLSIFLFMNVAVFGVALLLATGRMG